MICSFAMEALIRLFILFIFITYLTQIHNKSDIIVSGNGDHLVVILHGVYGTPAEFDNLVEGINSRTHTVILPGSRSGFKSLYLGLDQQTKLVLDEIKTCLNNEVSPDLIECKDIRSSEMKKLSIIGYGYGGIIAKKFIKKTSSYFQNLTKEEFMTINTPHLGIGEDYIDYNITNIFGTVKMNFSTVDTIRNYFLKFLFMWGSPRDLYDKTMYYKTEYKSIGQMSKYKRVTNYIESWGGLYSPLKSICYGQPDCGFNYNYTIPIICEHKYINTIDKQFCTPHHNSWEIISEFLNLLKLNRPIHKIIYSNILDRLKNK